MIIAISGLTGCGKNTLGELLAKDLGYKIVSPTFKDLADREGISLMDFQKKAEKDPNIDKKFDQALLEMADKNCVVTTWLGPWIVNADLRIKVFCPDNIRSERVAKRDGMDKKTALKHILERDEANHKRYLSVYKIDIYNTDIFDICLNSGKLSKEELKNIALNAINLKMKNIIR